jgi:hypothetical protein
MKQNPGPVNPLLSPLGVDMIASDPFRTGRMNPVQLLGHPQPTFIEMNCLVRLDQVLLGLVIDRFNLGSDLIIG